MRKLKRIFALIIALNILLGICPNVLETVSAAPKINVQVESYQAGTLNIRWDLLQARDTTVITYHAPVAGGGVEEKTITVAGNSLTPNRATIIGLENDYIYSIKVEVKNINGTTIGEDLMLFLPQISFYSEVLDQQAREIDGGGNESGVMPALKLSWALPKIYSSNFGTFVNVHRALNVIGPQVAKLDFKINITEDSQLEDVAVKFQGLNSSGNPIYKTEVSDNNNDIRTSEVLFDDTSNMLSFYLLGVKQKRGYLATKEELQNNIYVSGPDTGKEVLPNDIRDSWEYVLPHKEILPGTVYHMMVNAMFADSTGKYLDVVTYNRSGNPLMGKFNYTYTPIRFELTKDPMDNVYIKIFKVNTGNLNLPRLYYEVQTNTVPSNQDGTWTLRKMLDDTYFTGEFAYTVISGINPNNLIYYRILVKTDGSEDRLESIKMPYILKNDTSRPPIPRDVMVIRRELVTKPGMEDKSTDITISWEKPSNWDEIKRNTDMDRDVVFHFLINTHPSDLVLQNPPALEAEGKYYGSFPAVYRLEKYVSARSSAIRENGNRLEYTIKGYELFKGEYMSGYDAIEGRPVISVEDFNPHEKDADGNEYPDYLLPNKVYYMQMYTTFGADRGSTLPAKMSDKSLVVSFTTLSATEREVPLPNNFKVIKNEMDQDKVNSVELQFDKVRIDWNNYSSNRSQNDKIYYDLYMSTRTEASSFVLIGSTEYTDKDVFFEGADDPQSVFIRARISKFEPLVNAYYPDIYAYPDLVIDPYEVFGQKLLPNATYYFVIRTRLVMENPPNPPNDFIVKESIPTAILPVTTIKGGIDAPDETSKRPLAPTDFAIAKDSAGNLLLTGQQVTFNWSKLEEGVTYTLICTSNRISSNAVEEDYINDPVYRSFISEFGRDDNDGDNSKLTINPDASPMPQRISRVFKYDRRTKTFTFKIDRWLFPNKLYYFSLRAETQDKKSVWICIPVTTTLIEGPTALEIVNGAEIGFVWIDTSLNMKAEDYRVFLKGPKDLNYKQLNRSQSTVVKDGSTFYGRVYNLDPNTLYSIRVYKGQNNNTLVHDMPGVYTRDGAHQLEVKWVGPAVDNYYKYEIAIRSEEQTDYTTLASFDYDQYAEKTSRTLGTSNFAYHAKIKTAAVKLPDGTTEHWPLKSNMKYYIKVRAVKINPANTVEVTWSKYIGPKDTRTEFDQGDYDKEDQNKKKVAAFLDKVAKLEEALYWKMQVSNHEMDKILLKGDRLVNAIENSSSGQFTLDISSLGSSVNTDVVYVPANVIKTLNSKDKSLVIKTSGAEFMLRPRTLDMDNASEITAVGNKTGVKDMLFKVSISQGEYPSVNLPGGTKRLSKVAGLEVQVMGTSKSYKQLKDDIHDKVYNDAIGLVKQRVDILTGYYGSIEVSQRLDKLIDGLVLDIESELSDYINDTVEGTASRSGITIVRNSLKTFGTPMVSKLKYSDAKGMKVPYVNYDSKGSWQKITNDVTDSYGYLSFNVTGTGKYTVLTAAAVAVDVPADYWAKNEIDRLMAKYDLSDVFGGTENFYPEDRVSVREIVLLYEKVVDKAEKNSGMDIKQKVKELGLEDIVSTAGIMKNLQRQEAAAVIMRLYSLKLNVDLSTLKPKRNIFI